MNMADPTRTIPIEALDRAERIQEATARLTAVFVRHGGAPHPLGLELDELVREFEQVARETEREECAKACEALADDFQERESQRWPEMKTDAERGCNRCAAAIRDAHGA